MGRCVPEIGRDGKDAGRCGAPLVARTGWVYSLRTVVFCCARISQEKNAVSSLVVEPGSSVRDDRHRETTRHRGRGVQYPLLTIVCRHVVAVARVCRRLPRRCILRIIPPPGFVSVQRGSPQGTKGIVDKCGKAAASGIAAHQRFMERLDWFR